MCWALSPAVNTWGKVSFEVNPVFAGKVPWRASGIFVNSASPLVKSTANSER